MFFLHFASGHWVALGLLRERGIDLVRLYDVCRPPSWSPDHSGTAHALPGGRALVMLDLKEMANDITRVSQIRCRKRNFAPLSHLRLPLRDPG